MTEQERDELLATTAYFFVQRALKARTFKNQSKWVKTQDMGGDICSGLNLVLVQIFKTGSIFIFFCHVLITIIWNNGK